MIPASAKGGREDGGNKPSRDASSQFEKMLGENSRPPRYLLRLYIAGTTPRSAEAVANLRKLCEEYIPDRYNLEVVDIYQQPAEAINAQIVAAPTLIKHLPKPIKRLIGNLSDREKLIVGLNLEVKKD